MSFASRVPPHTRGLCPGHGLSHQGEVIKPHLSFFVSLATHPPLSVSFSPLSHSTASLSSTRSSSLAGKSDSTGYTSDGRRDSYRAKGESDEEGRGNEHADAGEKEDEMRNFLLGPGWYDTRVPPAERLKHLYRLLGEHYDLTGGDYYGQSSLHLCTTIGGSKRVSQLEEYHAACLPYLASIGVELDFLGGSNDMSSDPMKDLIDEAFFHPPSLLSKYRTAPTSTWEIDWSRPLPKVTLAYWEMMHRTRPRPIHEFTRAKPVAVDPRVVLRPYRRQGYPPHYNGVEENAHDTSRLRGVVLHKVRQLVTLH
ncbi:hypothetical protein BJ322DRAFT_1068507 [Thelephora terrestris]|uniref:Uncharacterized protein n=1 Tax=Thelephora terrestris TaxID=56493 RepID=A0A9P6L5Y1_9AGAM|nr:hypothetical protein BJ322DRAFT_1068507 [Thelephora terrestris]